MAQTEAEKRAEERCHGGSWRAEVRSRILELKGRLTVVRMASVEPGQSAAARAASVQASNDCIGHATEASTTNGKWCALRSWWTGSALTEAWEAVHNAELTLLSVESDTAVKTAQPRILAWIQSAMDSGPRRASHEEKLKSELKEDGAKGVGRQATLRALADVIDANRKRYANLRAFRNTLIVVTFLLLLVILGIAAWHAANPDFFSLCATVGEEPETHVCPIGDDSQPIDIFLIAAVGALGGFLALAFGLAQAESAPSRFDPKAWQAFLKPVTGAATALVGVLFLQAGFLVEVPADSGHLMILVYAVIFGFSQQVLTQVVDKHAKSLIEPSEAKS